MNWLLIAFLLFAPSLALAQNQGQIVPSGQFTPGHTVRCQNSTCTVAVDGGGSAGSSINGQGYLTEIGITNTGTPFCINDALISNPNGYHQFCLGANALGGGLISYNAYGGANDLGLTFNLNGVNYSFPFAGTGNVVGPTSPAPTAGDLVLWNGGTTVKDGGLPPIDIIVPAGGSIQAALTVAATAGGGTVRVPVGTYPQTQILTMSSNTRLVCDKGALITTTNAGWSGPEGSVTNANAASTSRIDHDLIVEGCTFQALGTYTTDGAYHHIGIGAATRVRIANNRFIGGGDGTALDGDLDTTVSDNYMTGAENACWDHYGGPGTLAATSMTVSGNYCQTNFYGILVTGTNVGSVSAAVALNADVHGNTIVMSGGSAQAGIWVNGIGAAGSGASNIQVTNNNISGDGTAAFLCMKNSGAGNSNVFAHNTCSNVNNAAISQGFNDGADSGGTPTNTLLLGNSFIGVPTQNGDVALITLGGTGSAAIGNYATGGSYPSVVWLAGTNNRAINNMAATGTSDRYNTGGSTNPTIWDWDPAIAGQLFRVGNTLLRATTDCGSTLCVGVAGDSTSAIQVAQPSGGNEGIGTVNARGGFFQNGVQLTTILFGTTASIGGSPLSAGTCTIGFNASISGATTSMVATASPSAGTDPGDGIYWKAWISGANTATVKVCNGATGSLTPAAATYNVRVLQ